LTRDVDSLFVPHGVVLEEARNVAQELGMPTWWLNEQASVYISGKDDPGKRRVFDHPGLRVTAASPRRIFAMKALAARTRDVDDLRLLAEMIGVDSAAASRSSVADIAVPPWRDNPRKGDRFRLLALGSPSVPVGPEIPAENQRCANGSRVGG
jgi:hypothetical protein